MENLKLYASSLICFLLILISETGSAQTGSSMSGAINIGTISSCNGISYADAKSNMPTNGFFNNFGQPSPDIWYKFTITRSSSVNISLCGSSIDTYLHLLDINGNVLRFNNDDGPLCSGNTSSIQETALASGTYYIVTEGNGVDMGAMQLSLTVTGSGVLPEGADITSAIDVGTLGSGISRFYDYRSNADPCIGNDIGQLSNDIYYRFTIEKTLTVSLAHCGSSLRGTYIYLLNSSGSQIATAHGTGPLCGETSMRLSLAAGTYYLVSEGEANSIGMINSTILTSTEPPPPETPVPVVLPSVIQTSEHGSVSETLVRKSGNLTIAEVDSLTVNQAIRQVKYFDAFGRPLQVVRTRGNADATKDIVQPFSYDNFGREPLKYLPYTTATGASGSFRPDALKGSNGYVNSAQKIFYEQTGQGYKEMASPYSQTRYELSPLNRVVEQGSPGDPWQPDENDATGHTLKTAPGLNAINEVKFWSTSSTGAAISGFYPAGRLFKTITKDENWVAGKSGVVEEFRDLEGHVVLRRFWENENVALSTYYIYNVFGELVYVLPPGVNVDTFTEADAIFLNYIYGYHYDNRNRLVEKKLPGKGWEYIVYNQLDQAVATQDAEQRKQNAWMITRYDKFGRIIMTGIWNNGNVAMSAHGLNMWVYGGALWDVKNSGHPHGYELKSYPLVLDTVLSVDYYDDYTIPGLPLAYDKHAVYSSKTMDKLTASKTLVLNGSSEMLWNVNYYDDNGNLVSNISQRYKGGVLAEGNYDETVNTYSFTDELLTSTRSHKVGGTEQLKIKTRNDYDHVGRLVNTWQQINSGDSILLARNEYNELGQLKTKRLHSTNGGEALSADITLTSSDIVNSGQQKTVTASGSITLADGFEAKSGSVFKASITDRVFLQTISYAYNERGWLKQINDPAAVSSTGAFGMKLFYNDHTDPLKQQFNGNISGVNWQSKVPSGLGFTQEQQSYDYSYDKLNRLKLADYITAGKQGHFNESLTYDVMGNITGLQRNASGTLIDQLSYSYDNSNLSNRLTGVTDVSGNDAGLTNGATVYTYDDNGNQISDDRKALQIKYNLLNLPKLIKNTTTSETLTYIYDAAGRKLRKVVTGGNRDYIDGIEYDNNGNLEFFSTPEGRAVKTGSTYSYEYMLKDHLGNIRSVVKQDGSILQAPDYYAFGMEMNHNGVTPSPDNKYKYNGKEQQAELGLNQLDYGARFYDPVTGRWNIVDPLAEKYRRWSPYNYVMNNPIRFIDPDGMGVYTSSDDIQSLLDWAKTTGTGSSPPTDYLDEDGNLIAGTDDGIDRNVTVRNYQRKSFKNKMNNLIKLGLSNNSLSNSYLSDEIDNENFANTANIRNAIGEAAESHVGDKSWNFESSNGDFGINVEKCNLFISDMIKLGGGVAPTNDYTGKYPLQAGKWGDGNSFVRGWVTLQSGATPQKGDVAAFSMQYLNATGHGAIVTGRRTAVGTSDSTHQINTSGFDFRGGVPEGVKVIFRRYIGYSN